MISLDSVIPPQPLCSESLCFDQSPSYKAHLLLPLAHILASLIRISRVATTALNSPISSKTSLSLLTSITRTKTFHSTAYAMATGTERGVHNLKRYVFDRDYIPDQSSSILHGPRLTIFLPVASLAQLY